MSFIRTVCGDIAPESLGVCYAHEHIIIDSSFTTHCYPDFHLHSVENAVTELKDFHKKGGRSMVDSMPCDSGRNVEKLAEISLLSGVNIIAPTGIHLAKYYDEGHWSNRYSADELAALFIADIEDGIDIHDYNGPLVTRSKSKAGLIKIATGETITDREERVFEAAAEAHHRTGSPILTHTEQGTLAIEQVELLNKNKVDISKVVLSHTDRNPDLAYHRSILQTGVNIEFDSAFRWKEGNPTLDLLVALLPDFPNQIMLGMDAARKSYWKSYGGAPGLCYLLDTFTRKMKDAGIPNESLDRIFISNPAQAYQFKH